MKKFFASFGFFIFLFGFHPALAKSRDVNYIAHDGTTQHGVYFPASKLKAALLYFHGFQSHTGWLKASGFADRLAENGIAVFAYDRRGSGFSQSLQGHADSSRQLLMDVHDALVVFRGELLKDGHGPVLARLPFHMYANCFGMRIAIPYLASTEGSGRAFFQSVIATTPSTHMRPETEFTPLEKLEIGLKGHTEYTRSKLRDEWFVPSGPWLDFIRQDKYALREATTGFYKSANGLTKQMNTAMSQLTIPMLFVVMDQDKMVDSRAVRANALQKYLGRKKLVQLPGPHYVEFTPQQEALVYETVKWISLHSVSK